APGSCPPAMSGRCCPRTRRSSTWPVGPPSGPGAAATPRGGSAPEEAIEVPWQPPPRPEWVEAVNSGLIVPMTEEASRPLSRDDLLGEARARLGLDVAGSGQALVADFGSEDFLEPLDVLLPALEEEARLTVIGRWLTRRFLLRLLEVRLQLVAYARADPGVLDEEIAEPWFVTGAPRTGTTILHSLLAQDERHRVPVGWELLRPVPPPDPGNAVGDPRIPLADF